MVERHAEEGVARFEQGHVGGVVGLGAGVGLDVDVVGAEQRLGPVDRQFLADVDLLAAAVVAAAGVALGVLVGQHRADRVEDGLGHEVLRGDHLQRPLLAAQLPSRTAAISGSTSASGAVWKFSGSSAHGGDDSNGSGYPGPGETARRLRRVLLLAFWRPPRPPSPRPPPPSRAAENPCLGKQRDELLCPNLRIGPPTELYIQPPAAERPAAGDQRRPQPRPRPDRAAGQAQRLAVDGVNQRIYRKGGGHIDPVPTPASASPTSATTAAAPTGRCTSWRASSCAGSGPTAAWAPSSAPAPSSTTACATSSGPAPERARRESPLPRLQPEPLPRPGHARHLGRLVGHLPGPLRQAVDQGRRPARLLRLRNDRRPPASALRVERGRQHLAPPGATAVQRRDGC